MKREGDGGTREEGWLREKEAGEGEIGDRAKISARMQAAAGRHESDICLLFLFGSLVSF